MNIFRRNSYIDKDHKKASILIVFSIILVLFYCSTAFSEDTDIIPFLNLSADDIHVDYDNGKPSYSKLTGNVSAKYKNLTIKADKATINFKTNEAIFEDNVIYKIDEQEAKGEMFFINISTGSWHLEKAVTTIEPESNSNYIAEPIFLNTDKLEGVKLKNYKSFDSDLTTCNLNKHHYDIKASTIEIYPNEKIIFRNASFYMLGHKLFTLSKLALPLNNDQPRAKLIPSVGQSQEEGFYLKAAYPYTASSSETGLFLLDLMSKKGIGTGISHNYNHGSSFGDIQLYQINDNTTNENTITGTLNHTQKVGTFDLNIGTDFRTNSYLYAPKSKSVLNRFSISHNNKSNQTSLIINQSINNSFNRTSNLSASLSHLNNLNKTSFISSRFDYTGFNTNGTNNESRLNSKIDYTMHDKVLDWGVSTEAINNLGAESFIGSGRFSGLEKLPELYVKTDSKKIGNILPFGIPANFLFKYGKYVELPANTQLDRYNLELNTPQTNHNISNSWSFLTSSGFRQFFYSNETAQYAYSSNVELKKELGNESFFSLNYKLQQQKGYTPFRFDYLGNYNALNSHLQLKDSKHLKMTLYSGYNFEQPQYPWQDITIRMSIMPSENILLYTSTGYDINRSRWRTLINQIRIRNGECFKIDLGTRYDNINHKWANLNGKLDTKIDRKTRVQAIAGYDGFTKQFDYRSLMLTRDLHCWEASLIYTNQSGFYEDNSIMLNFRIKAFPIDQAFGMGQYGQMLDSSVGEIY